MITNSIYEKKQLYAENRAVVLKKYFKESKKNMLEIQNNFLAVADYCCKAMLYVTLIKENRTIRFIYELLRPDWQQLGVDISYGRFSKLLQNVHSMKGKEISHYKGSKAYGQDDNLDDGLRVTILDQIVSKACKTDKFYRYVICMMKAEQELRLIRMFENMAERYNDLKSYKGGQDV